MGDRKQLIDTDQTRLCKESYTPLSCNDTAHCAPVKAAAPRARQPALSLAASLSTS